jgi:hypothetical protein
VGHQPGHPTLCARCCDAVDAQPPVRTAAE